MSAFAVIIQKKQNGLDLALRCKVDNSRSTMVRQERTTSHKRGGNVPVTVETKTARRVECPSCGKKAKPVGTITLRALLKEEFAKRFTADGHSCCDTTGESCAQIMGDTGWRFCGSTDCDVVYFSEEGDTTFT